MTRRFWRDKTPLNPHMAAMEEINAQGDWNDVDYAYILSCHRVRKVRRIEAGVEDDPRKRRNGKPIFTESPQSWTMAIEMAKQEEQHHLSSLSKEHGYPNTDGLEQSQAHQLRLQHLMGKYPNANWELLMIDQFSGWDRKPTERKPPPPVTIQKMESDKRKYLMPLQQLNEFIAYGDVDDAFIVEWKQTLERNEKKLVHYGFNIDELLTENAELVNAIPLDVPLDDRGRERLQERVTDLTSSIAEMEEYELSRDTELPENRIIAPTKRVLERYLIALDAVGSSKGVVSTSTAPASTSVETVETSVSTSSPQVQTVGEPGGTKPVVSDALLSTREAAELVGIAYNSMLRELNSGRFPFANKLAGQWKISHKGLTDWLSGHRDDVEALKTTPQQPRTTVSTKTPSTSERVLTTKARQAHKPLRFRADGTVITF